MDSLKNALETALDMEHSGYSLYMQAAKSTSNLLGKSTLEAIAAKELDHIKAIETFAKNNLDKAIVAINPKSKKDYIQPIMKKLEKALHEKISPDSDLDQAYRVALELEKNSFEFYKNLKEKSGDVKAKKFFEFLMGEENTHYEILKESLEYLNHPGNWYREQERWVVEGG